MPRWKPPEKARRDANEGLIVDALEAHGFIVTRMDQPVDLLVSKGGHWWPVEVKNPVGRNRLEGKQREFIERHHDADVPILRTVDDVAELAEKVKEIDRG